MQRTTIEGEYGPGRFKRPGTRSAVLEKSF
jgi:hypothetical protein